MLKPIPTPADWETLQTHPAADAFPMMTEAEMSELVANIEAVGFDGGEPVVLCGGAIVDGRNRRKACLILKERGALSAPPPFAEWVGEGSVIDWVLTQNLFRRHLSASQKACVAVEMLPLYEVEAQKEKAKRARAAAAMKEREGGRFLTKSQRAAIAIGASENGQIAEIFQQSGNRQRNPEARKQVSERVGVNGRYVSDAKSIREQAPDLFEQMKAGQLSLQQAKRTLAEEDEAENFSLKAACPEPRRMTGPPPPMPEGQYFVILADPPWVYEGGTTTPDRTIEQEYPTMTLADICALPVNALAEKNAVLFMWSTSPKLAEAMRVIEAWGFNYRTSMVWVKNGLGMGNYARQNHELLLIAVKGKPGCPEPENRPHSVIHAKKRQHSEKPVRFHEIIDSMYPAGRRIELFARERRAGWDAWGNEVPDA